MKKAIKDWLIILASLADDIAIILVLLLVIWLLKIPVTWPIFTFLAVFFVTSAFITYRLVLPALRRRKSTGAEGMLELEGEVVEPLTPLGMIIVEGEHWKARSVNGNIPAGQKVEIIKLNGLTFDVRRKQPQSQ